MSRSSLLRHGRRSHIFASPLNPTLEWDINIKPIKADDIEIEGYRAIQRNDNGKTLNIVKDGYNAGSNQMFMDTVNKLRELTGFALAGYSEFDGGKKILAYLQNPEPIKIGEFDNTNYLVMGNSFDYSMSWFSGLTQSVHRCTNEFGQIQPNHRIKHNNQLGAKVDELVKFYQRYIDQERMLTEKFETWSGIRIPTELKELFVDHVLEIDPHADEEKPTSKIKQNQRVNLFHSINSEIGAMGDNAYGLFNGLTHYTTHVVKSQEKVFGNVLGHTAKLNSRGFQFLNEHALELV